MILDKIACATRRRLDAAMKAVPADEMARRAEESPRLSGFPFEAALRGSDLRFICEIKRASPSKGLIAAEFHPCEIARAYERAGAAAISVLTEPEFFLGSLDHLLEARAASTLPILRKDFVLDAYQLYEARAAGASAVLLICALLEAPNLRDLIALADRLGLSALVEAHDEGEVDKALSAGARVVGVNNRDLQTFQVDLNVSLRLRNRVPSAVIFVAESGISAPEDVKRLREAGIDAALVGEALMRALDPASALQALRGDG